MAGISSSATASIKPVGHGGGDGGDDDTSPLLDLLQKLPDLSVDKEDAEVHDRSATEGTPSSFAAAAAAAAAAEPPEAVGPGGCRHVIQRFEPATLELSGTL